MASITAIVESPRHPGRYAIMSGADELALLSVEAISRLELRIGLALDAARLEALHEEGAVQGAYDRALNLLAFRPRARSELRRRLLQRRPQRMSRPKRPAGQGRGTEPEPASAMPSSALSSAQALPVAPPLEERHVDAALERLAAAGLIDDAEFARTLARSRLLGRGSSKRRVEQEMWKKGVDATLAKEAIADVVEQEGVDERETVEAVARKKYRTLAKLDRATQKRRLYAFLARRGYDGEAIRHAMGAVLGAGGSAYEASGDEGAGEDDDE